MMILSLFLSFFLVPLSILQGSFAFLLLHGLRLPSPCAMALLLSCPLAAGTVFFRKSDLICPG